MAVALAVVGVGAYLALRGAGSESARTSAANVQHFCELAQRVDDATAPVAPVPGVFSGAPDAIRTTAAALATTLDDFERAAPSDVRGETRTVVDGLRAAANGDVASVQSAKFKQAYAKSSSFRSRTCSAGTPTGGEG